MCLPCIVEYSLGIHTFIARLHGLCNEVFNKIEGHEIKQNTRSSKSLKIKIQEVRINKCLVIKLLLLGSYVRVPKKSFSHHSVKLR